MPLFLRHSLWLAMICAWCVHNSHQPQMPNQIIKFVVRKCALLTHLRLWCVNSPVVTLNNKKTSTPRLCFWFFCSHFHFGCRLFNPDENKKNSACWQKEALKNQNWITALEGCLSSLSVDDTINTKKCITEEIMAILCSYANTICHFDVVNKQIMAKEITERKKSQNKQKCLRN